MRLLLISDLHANMEALNSILETIEYDSIYCMGDLVDYGPDPAGCINWIRSNNIPTIRGNHDNAVALHVDCGCGYKYKHLSEATRDYTWDRITPADEEYLMNLPLRLDFEVDGLKITAVHGSPASFFDYIYPDTSDDKLETYTAGLDCDYLFTGHTHKPAVLRTSRMTVLNPGSAGQPRDGDWRASCMVLDTATGKPEIFRTEYDIESTCEKIREDMPHADELEEILRRGY